MTIVTVIHFVRKVPFRVSTAAAEGDWHLDNVATVTSKRKVLSVEGEVNVWKTNIKCKEEDWRVGDFCLMNSTILTICKNGTKITGAFERNGPRIRRIRKTERSDVDEALLNWFQQ